MLFLLEHAPLKPWQADVLSIIRDEAYYFAPQAQTKIMNEGWASYWHSTIMTRQGLDRGRRGQLLRPPLRHAGQLADAAESLQAGHRAVPRHRRPLEPRRASARSTTSATTRAAARLEHRRGPGPGEDLRGPPDPQRPDVHRRVPDARLLPRAQAVLVSATTRAATSTKSKAASSPRSSSNCCSASPIVGRPIIAVVDGNYKNRGELYLRTQILRRRTADRTTPTTRWKICSACGAGRFTWRLASRMLGLSYRSTGLSMISRKEKRSNCSMKQRVSI